MAERERKKYNQIISAGFASRKKTCLCVFWRSFIYTVIWDLTAGIPTASFGFSMTPPSDPSREDYPLVEDSTLGLSARPGAEVL